MGVFVVDICLGLKVFGGWSNGIAGYEAVVSIGHHATREVVHDGLRLDMEVSLHFVRAPPTNESDGVMVNVGAEKCHGAGSAKRVSADVTRSDAQSRTKLCQRKTECCGDVIAVHCFGATPG